MLDGDGSGHDHVAGRNSPSAALTVEAGWAMGIALTGVSLSDRLEGYAGTPATED